MSLCSDAVVVDGMVYVADGLMTLLLLPHWGWPGLLAACGGFELF
jgi:hypothetical protein